MTLISHRNICSYFYLRFLKLWDLRGSLNFEPSVHYHNLHCQTRIYKDIVLETLTSMDLTKYLRMLIHLVGNEIYSKECFYFLKRSVRKPQRPQKTVLETAAINVNKQETPVSLQREFGETMY